MKSDFLSGFENNKLLAHTDLERVKTEARAGQDWSKQKVMVRADLAAGPHRDRLICSLVASEDETQPHTHS